MARPAHFEIPVDDPDRAEKFYGTIFGWFATCKDPEGSTFGLFTNDPSAE